MILSRIAEEVGELAKEVNHLENSGVKVTKLGEPSKINIAKEAQDVIRAVLQLVEHYGVRTEFEDEIDESYDRFRKKYSAMES